MNATPDAMPRKIPADLLSRERLMQELSSRYPPGGGAWLNLARRWPFWRKKYAWLLVIGGAQLIKRSMDLMAALLLLILLSPLFAGVALIIKLTDRGPVFYFQRRVGKWGREFTFPKFRSMYTNSDQVREKLLAQSDLGASITFKMKKDPRITPIGRIIRKLSIDELPQLWCVLTGQMSLVGPRPPLPKEVAQYTLSDRRRLDVTPGLTCIWQVSGRSDIPFDKQVLLDVKYIESQSLWLDLKLLFQTVPAVLLGKGAY